MIELTEQQLQAVKNGDAVRIAISEIGEDVVLLRAAQYERIQELLDKYSPVIDPVEPFIGAFESDVPDWADQHDKYLGQALMEEMRGNSDPGR